MVFFAHSVLSRKMTKDLKSVWSLSKNRRRRLTFMSIGVFSVYGKNSWCILHIRLFSFHVLSMYENIFGVFGDCIIEISHKSLIFSVTIKYFWRKCTIKYLIGRLFRICLTIFCVFSEYAERFKNNQKEIFTSINYNF
jgi:hypothetical protein